MVVDCTRERLNKSYGPHNNSMYKYNLGINYNNQRVQPEDMFIQSIMSTSPCQNILLGKMESVSFHLLKKSLGMFM